MFSKSTHHWIFLLPLAFTACSGGNFYVPTQYPVVPNPSTSPATELEIFHVGETSPLTILEGYTKEIISLEVRGGDAQFAPIWFSSNVTRGDFLSPGELALRGVGDFEIRVHVGPQSKSLLVRVSHATSAPIPTPDSEIPTEEEPSEEAPTSSPIPAAINSDSFVDEVISFRPGSYAGYGSSQFPEIILGPPQGGGLSYGGTDVLSLGVGGEIILKSDTPIRNEAGIDFIVFENPFYAGGDPNNAYIELGEVAVSQDGIRFFSFPCETQNRLEDYPGCAGVHPVLANSQYNQIDPTNSELAGGDPFDLDEVGLNWVQYLRIRDLSRERSGNNAGFDLDAISIIHQ